MKRSLDMSYSPWYYVQYLYNEMKRSPDMSYWQWATPYHTVCKQWSIIKAHYT